MISISFIYLVIISLLIGSFLNVCIYRIPQRVSIAYPSSHCPNCKTNLKPVDLIPVLSYLFYKGKCRYCDEKISIQYPLIELLNVIIYISLYIKFGLTIHFFLYAILSSVLLVISVIDLKFSIIPDELLILGMLIGLIYAIYQQSWIYLLSSSLGLLLGGGIFLLIAFVSNGAMGGGDIKLMAVLGFWFGWKKILLIAFLAFVIGAIISIVLIILKIKGRKDYIPFGPFIALAAFLVIYTGNSIMDWYIKLIM